MAGIRTKMTVEVRQPEGFRFDQPSTDPLEVSPPVGSYTGPMHHESFSKAAEQYYREAFKSAFRIGEGVTNTQIRNSRITIGPRTYFIEMPERSGTQAMGWATS